MQTPDAPAGVFCDAEQALQCERCPDAARLGALLGAATCTPAKEPAEASREAPIEPAGSMLEAVCDTRDAGGEQFYRVSDSRARTCFLALCVLARRACAGLPDHACGQLEVQLVIQ